MVKIVYKGRASKLRHYGRSEERIDYEFTRGVPVDVIEKTDAAYFKQKAEKNPETWGIVLPPKPKKEPKKEPDPPPPEDVEEPSEPEEKKTPAKAPKKTEAK